MGLIRGLTAGSGAVETLGRAAQGIAEVFHPNATEGQRMGHAAQQAALAQLSEEFDMPARGWFDRCVDGLNRLPRPMLALGTLGLFVYAMVDPAGFARRMEGLAFVPDPLWWLLGAIVGFYFGARELHYVRRVPPTPRPAALHSSWHAADEETVAEVNPALGEWAAARD
ncbi:Holin of 3TMs, for gene-transfer release [Jannaschia faecimaris]|uniref:Holin of 3TMs, for gene-transfer release n=1 Tax=Jannaschia faecimaris TaxID=1244108 RepID=A0A1H3RXP5_9RHOB|nr:holin family protein [Jannaschia faecimaris]SDZ30464.1 Holin of 3TMs, for gene-transfer release [Jannaschia faecimaris]